MNEAKLKIEKQCPLCGGTTELLVDDEAYWQWRNGMLVQKAFPDMPPEQREILISGYHPACWDHLFNDGEPS